MAMNLNRRLQALEQVVVPPDDHGCEVCGCESGSELEFKVSFADEPEIGPDVCPRCGRPMILRLEFDEPPRSVESPRSGGYCVAGAYTRPWHRNST